MATRASAQQTRDDLVRDLADELRRGGASAAANEAEARLAALWRNEGVLSEDSIEHLILMCRPGGEKKILPGETRKEAVARIQRHYGYDERTAHLTIRLSEGWSDLVPVDDDGTELPYFRIPEEERERWE